MIKSIFIIIGKQCVYIDMNYNHLGLTNLHGLATWGFQCLNFRFLQRSTVPGTHNRVRIPGTRVVLSGVWNFIKFLYFVCI